MKRLLPGRFFRHKGGATAVEFALVVVPFLALIFVIIEVGLIYFSNAALDDALRRSTDEIQTGVAHERKMTAQQFKAGLCARLPSFMSCRDVIVDVRRVTESGFDDYAINGDVRDITGDFRRGVRSAFCIGGAGEYILARTSYRFPNVFIFAIERSVSIGGRATYTTEASRVFRNEPFLFEAPRC